MPKFVSGAPKNVANTIMSIAKSVLNLALNVQKLADSLPLKTFTKEADLKPASYYSFLEIITHAKIKVIHQRKIVHFIVIGTTF